MKKLLKEIDKNIYTICEKILLACIITLVIVLVIAVVAGLTGNLVGTYHNHGVHAAPILMLML